ncbi:MAG: hypothetical protein AB7F40_05355 [Victivallaceae bacterium]|nr:hypothetical protein [Victivallaceae bacterium]
MKKIRIAGWIALLSAFIALPTAAFEPPPNGSYEELAKLVPCDARMVIYENATKIYESGWYERIKALPIAGKLFEQSVQIKDGNVIMFSGDLKSSPNLSALFYWKDSSGIDELAKMERAGFTAMDCSVSVENIELNGHPGFKMTTPGMPMEMRFIQLAPDWFMFGMDERSMSSYLALGPDKLGMNPEMAKVLEPYKDKMFFGTVMVPQDEQKEMSRIDFFGDITAEAMTLKLVVICRDNKCAVEGETAIKQIMPMMFAAADQEMPGISKLLSDSIKVSVEGGDLVIDVVIPVDKMDQLIVMTSEFVKQRQEQLKAEMEAAKTAAEAAQSYKATVEVKADEPAPAVK